MEPARVPERRKTERGKNGQPRTAQLWLERQDGSWHKVAVEIQDAGEHGIGLLLGELLREGVAVLIEGGGVTAADGGRVRGGVAWCKEVSTGVFRAGIAIDGKQRELPGKPAEFEDHYETLEVNAAASFDTIQKVYRVLAQRIHPDNAESGNEEGFKRLVQAYRILSDPEKRAAFDVARTNALSKRWRIFDPETAIPGLEQEQRKRRAILAVLYNKRMRQPENGGVSISEIEQLLAVPREHLEFPVWFMKEQGWIQRTDAGKLSITARGVDHAESTGAWQPPMVKNAGLLPAAAR